MRSQIFTMALALAPLVSAVSWPNVLPGLDVMAAKRQDGTTKTTPTNGPTQTNSPSTTAKPSGTTTTNTKGPITTDLNTGGNEPTGSPGNGTTGHSGNSSQIFNPLDPAGGVVMLTPAAKLGTQLLKIEGTPVTWVWNYTSVQGAPSAVDVLVSCSAARQTITLTQNMTYQSPQTLTWDHAGYAATAVADRLITDKYTLVVFDSNSSPTEQASSGYLAPFTSFVFGLYKKQDYKDLEDGWQCVTCSGAHGSLERTAIGFATSMSIITILSFTWFVGGFGAML